MATTASKNPRAARKAAPARKTAAPAAKRPAAPREAAVARKAPVVKKEYHDNKKGEDDGEEQPPN